jgi:Bacterial Ig-like domain (group 3)
VHRSVHRIFGRTRATVIGAALLSGAALPAAGLWAGTASAAPICSETAGVTTCTFAYTGHATSFQVPVGVTALTVVADGGAGANGVTSSILGAGAGGKGGEYKATLTGVTSGSVLSIFPGGAATGKTGGINQSGHGGNGSPDTNGTSGGGGGASTVALSPFSVGNVLVAAGGGGGGGALNPLLHADGGNGGGSGNGATGDDGHPILGAFGHGGTPLVGGASGGTLGCTVSAVGGSQFAGGNSNSGTCTVAGGAGGGGYFGGGGAAALGGGGGGGARPAAPGVTVIHGITITPDTTDHNTNTGNGVVSISYTGHPPTTTFLSSSHDPSFFGQPVTFTATVAPLDGGVFDGHGTVAFKDGTFTIPGCSAVTLHHVFGTWRAFCTSSTLHVGPNFITATYSGDTHWAGSFSNTVIQLVRRAPTHLSAAIAFNIHQTFTVSGKLTSFFTPVAGEPLIFTTGHTFLCATHTDSHGIGTCVLSYYKSVAIRQNAGRFTVFFPGTSGYFPSHASGQGIISP